MSFVLFLEHLCEKVCIIVNLFKSYSIDLDINGFSDDILCFVAGAKYPNYNIREYV